jgi:hypothetical protein
MPRRRELQALSRILRKTCADAADVSANMHETVEAIGQLHGTL